MNEVSRKVLIKIQCNLFIWQINDSLKDALHNVTDQLEKTLMSYGSRRCPGSGGRPQSALGLSPDRFDEAAQLGAQLAFEHLLLLGTQARVEQVQKCLRKQE